MEALCCSFHSKPKILLFHLKQLDYFYVLNCGVLIYDDVKRCKHKI